MPEMTTKWRYPLVYTNENKGAARTAVGKGVAWDQIGIDGSANGGKRPHPGFKFFKSLSGVIASDRQEVKGFFPVTFRASSDTYAYGFVYRVVDSDDNRDCKYFLEYRIGDDLTWIGPIDLVGSKSNGNKQMNVTVYGRFVYVFVSGSEPFVFYLNEDPEDVFTLVINDDTGPGAAPQIFDQPFHQAATSGAYDEAAVFDTTNFYVDVPANGRARFLHWVFWPDTTIQTTPVDGENFNISGAVILGATGPNTAGPSDLLSGQLTQNAPTLFDWGTGGAYEGIQYQGNGGGEDAPTPIVTSSFDAKVYAYAYAYVLYDSRTGRKSLPSTKQVIAYPNTDAYSPWKIGGTSLGAKFEELAWGLIDVLYPEDLYDTVLMYRSPGVLYNPATQNVPSESEFLLKLDSIRTLADYDVTIGGAGEPAGFKRSVIFYHLSNEQIVTQDDLVEEAYLEEMPTGGSSLFYEKTMLVGKTGRMNPDVGGLGTFWWSNLLALSVELFKASDKYLMTMPDEEVERFLFLGPNVLAMTKQGLYLVRRETFFLKAFPLHQGFGVTGARAATTIGSDVYYLTGQGIKVIDPTGALSDVDSINDLLLNSWSGSVGQVEFAFDATCKVLTVLNPVQGHAALFWTQTGQVTELYDCWFKHVTEGNVPYRDQEGSPLEMRACFLQEATPDGGDGWEWNVYVMDYARQKDLPLMMDPSGTVLMSATEDFTTGTEFTCDDAGFGARVSGCTLYVLDGPLAGRKARIASTTSSHVLELHPDDAENLYGVTTGTRLGLSPMYFRWTGAQLGMETEQGVPFMDEQEYFQTRQADTLGCMFVDVADNGSSSTTYKDARFRAALYHGTETEQKTASFPTDTDGEKVESVRNGPSRVDAAFVDPSSPDSLNDRTGYASSSVFPSVEVFVPGLDFRLLGVIVSGIIRGREASGEQAP